MRDYVSDRRSAEDGVEGYTLCIMGMKIERNDEIY